jgi:exopolysaccharide biosynthesis polyprenyl glycosylphosphotransferase
VQSLNMEDFYDEYAAALEGALHSDVVSDSIFYDFTKRLVDIILSIIGIVFGLPIMAVFCILIVLESKGCPIYKQDRVGKNGKIFTLYKLRSMYNDAEKDGAQWAQADDPRVTKVGAFIRKTRIDEIPQFFNVLMGDMSIVGPRPERLYFTIEFNKDIPGFVNRLLVKPGLTGWAQVNGGYEMTPKEKWEADMYYIKNRNLYMDFVVILKTVKVVFTGDGAR